MKIYIIFAAFLIGVAKAQQSLVCANVPHASFVRHPRGCHSYYVCMNGTAHARDCPPGLKFEVSGICEFPKHVDCSACSPFGFQSIRYPGSCRRYIECNQGERTILECSPGLYFDTVTLSCNLASLVNCTEAPATTTPFPTTENPTNTTWDWDIPDFPTDAPPVNPPNSTEPEWPPFPIESSEEEPPYPTDSSEEGWLPEEPISSEEDPLWPPLSNESSDEDLPPIECDPFPDHPCQGTSNIYLAHEYDCTRYYFCFFNHTWERKCPSKLHWNQLISACDLPKVANCVHRFRNPRMNYISKRSKKNITKLGDGMTVLS